MRTVVNQFIWVVVFTSGVVVNTISMAADWTWTESARRNYEALQNVQTLYSEFDLLDAESPFVKERSIDQWREWWNQWPREITRITPDMINEIFIETAEKKGFRSVQSAQQGDRGSATFSPPFTPHPMLTKITENSHLSAKFRLNSPRHSVIVTPRLPTFASPGNWSEPITDRSFLSRHIVYPDLASRFADRKVTTEGEGDGRLLRISNVRIQGILFSYVVDQVTGVFVELHNPTAGFLSLAGDVRKLETGEFVPFRRIHLRYDPGSNPPIISRLRLWVVHEFKLNDDLTEEVRAKVPAKRSISVHGLPLKGGNDFFPDEPIDDVLEFVERKMRQPTLVTAQESPGTLRNLVMVALALLGVSLVIWWYRVRKTKG